MLTTNDNFTHIDPEEFKRVKNADPQALFLDVRTPEEYNSHHLHEAINIDFYEQDFSQKVGELDKDKTYLVYCQSGGRSSSAVEEMQKMGFTHVVGLKGGILGWELSGMMTEEENE